MTVVNYKTGRKVLRLPRKRAWKAAKSHLTAASWLQSGRTIDYETQQSLEALRARSREEAQNNDHVKHFLRLAKTNIIGPQGVALQGRVRRRMSDRPDDRANRALEDAWKRWGKWGVPDVSGRRSWHSIQTETVQNWAQDGEAIWRKLVPWDNEFGFALESLDPANLDVMYNEDLGDGRVVVMGVELDEWRRPIGYHFLRDERNVYRGGMSPQRTRNLTRIPADQIYHIYMPDQPLQTRGVPLVATALLRLHQLNGYEDAEVTAARVAAAKMGFYTQEESAGAYVGDDEDNKGNPIQDARPGEFEILPEGWGFQAWDPQHPNTQYGPFVQSALRAISSGLGVNYNTLANDLMGVNYTSLRHGMLSEREIWMMAQNWVIECFHEQVFNDWLEPALLSEAIVDQSGRPLLLSRMDDLRRVAWQPRRWPWVDPLKESQANRSDYDMRTRSLSDIIRENGRDPDEVWQEIAAENRRMEELGVTPTATAAPTNPTTDDDEETEDDEDMESAAQA